MTVMVEAMTIGMTKALGGKIEGFAIWLTIVMNVLMLTVVFNFFL